MNIDALYNLTHGVYVLGADDGGRPVGSAVDAVMQVASKPVVLALSCHSGYVYDGDTPFEELPDDWTCPVCGVDKSFFELR